jgi:hypothetical protein
MAHLAGEELNGIDQPPYSTTLITSPNCTVVTSLWRIVI